MECIYIIRLLYSHSGNAFEATLLKKREIDYTISQNSRLRYTRADRGCEFNDLASSSCYRPGDGHSFRHRSGEELAGFMQW